MKTVDELYNDYCELKKYNKEIKEICEPIIKASDNFNNYKNAYLENVRRWRTTSGDIFEQQAF